MSLTTKDKEVMRDAAQAVGALFEELMRLKPGDGRPGVRGSLFTPEQAAAIAGQCAPDILDRVVHQPVQATRARGTT